MGKKIKVVDVGTNEIKTAEDIKPIEEDIQPIEEDIKPTEDSQPIEDIKPEEDVKLNKEVVEAAPIKEVKVVKEVELVRCPDCNLRMLEKTLKYSHKCRKANPQTEVVNTPAPKPKVRAKSMPQPPIQQQPIQQPIQPPDTFTNLRQNLLNERAKRMMQKKEHYKNLISVAF